MEPLYKSLTVQLGPQPRQMPPEPLKSTDLQAIFSEVIDKYPYQTFGFTPDQRGAIFNNGPEDIVELRPAQFQIQAKLDGQEPLGGETAERKVMRILRIAGARLEMETFLQGAIQIIALAAVPGQDPDAKAFVAEHLMADGNHPNILGPRYFGGGVKFRSIEPDQSGEEGLSVEPFVQDNRYIYIEHSVMRIAVGEPITLDNLSSLITEAFEFCAGPTMKLLTQ
jgi:hypothetical protein